jgi:hypothetical protein
MTLGSLVVLALIVFVSGLAGGFLNALRTDNGNVGPTTVPLSGAAGVAGAGGAEQQQQSDDAGAAGAGANGQQQPPAPPAPPAGWRPGLVLNSLTGGVAAVLSWALYGPLAGINVLNLSEATQEYAMTLAAIGGAFFVGFGGARWLSAEADKRILQTSNTVMGDAAGTAGDNAAGVSGNAAEVSRNAVEVANKAAAVATDAAAATQDPQLQAAAQQVIDQATAIKGQAQEARGQAQEIQGQSQQLKEMAERVKVAESPAKVLNIVQRSAQAVG